MKLTYVDSSVLISAAIGKDEIAELAMEVLDDPDRSFASSVFVKLETLPKATFNRRLEETEFYKIFFDEVTKWAAIDESLMDAAFDEACSVGLSALDSLHVAAAVRTLADELVTAEKETKPLLRARLIPVRTIRPRPDRI